VYDPVAANRTATRSALFSLGFRHIEAVSDLASLADCIQNRPPDLLLCEVQGAEDELCRLIQNLRLGTGGYNPFVVIIVTAWEKSAATVNRVIDSGADDLLLRPFSASLLDERIHIHADRRKAFVVLADYVGPDRRKDPSRPPRIEVFEPPNSLRMKARDGLSAEQVTLRLDGEIKHAREHVTSRKLKQDAFQMCVLWRLLQSKDTSGARYEVDYAKLRTVTNGIKSRCAGTEFSQAAGWCDAALGAVKALELGVERDAALQMLGQSAVKLNQLFSPEKTAAEHLCEIDATVAIIRAKAQFAAAS